MFRGSFLAFINIWGVLIMLRKVFGRRRHHDHNDNTASNTTVSNLTEQLGTLSKEVVVVKEELTTAKAELTAAQKRLQRIDRLAALFSAGKDIGATAIARYLEQGNYPAARDLILSKVPEGEILIDFKSLDAEEGAAVIKGVLKRLSKTVDTLEDKEGVEPGAVKDVKDYLKILRTNKDLLVTNLTENGTLNFEALKIEDKTTPESKALNESAAAWIAAQQSIPVAQPATHAAPHPGLMFGGPSAQVSQSLPESTDGAPSAKAPGVRMVINPQGER
jgi:phage-related minor tail protein